MYLTDLEMHKQAWLRFLLESTHALKASSTRSQVVELDILGKLEKQKVADLIAITI